MHLLTGVFARPGFSISGSGFAGATPLGRLASGRAAQIGVQLLAALCAAGVLALW